MDRFTEPPRELKRPEREYSGEAEAERRERKIESDRHLLQYFYRRAEWYSWSTLVMTKLHFSPEKLEEWGFIESQEKTRLGRGFKAGRRLFE